MAHLLALALFWLQWPWVAEPLRIRLGHAASGRDLIVVLDGQASRFRRGDLFRSQILRPLPSISHSGQGEPEWLLVLCHSRLPAQRPVPVLLQGFDTVTQMIALAGWLQLRPAPPPRRVWIATDPGHTARATLLARMALAGQGVRVFPLQSSLAPVQEQRKLWRDVLRLTLWRATGTTGAWLAPGALTRRRSRCFGATRSPVPAASQHLPTT